MEGLNTTHLLTFDQWYQSKKVDLVFCWFCVSLSVLFPSSFLCRQFYYCIYLSRPQLENIVKKSMKPDIANIPSHVVHNQTATMLEIGTNLLTHTAEQTRKLNVVEAKVMSWQVTGLDTRKTDFLDLTACLPPGAEPHVSNRDPASGEFSVHQQAGERAVTADLRDQSATRQEQVEKFLLQSECA